MKTLYSLFLTLLVTLLNVSAQTSTEAFSGYKHELLQGVYTNTADKTLFIDFNDFEDAIAKITVMVDERVLLNDDVTDLSQQDIYEIHFSIFRTDIYIIDIETTKGKHFNYYLLKTNSFMSVTPIEYLDIVKS